ncbi:MAG TPA: right-handed parallel beta-helix repeat-containing protein [Gemmatimonadaceae bacterium]
MRTMALAFRHLSTWRSLVGVALVFAIAACSDITGVSPTAKPKQDASLDAGPTQSATYYVSPSGNDINNGMTPATAWRTIAKVNQRTFAAGDRILFQAGAVFAGSLFFESTDKGTAGAPIVLSSYGTGRATINAGTSDGILLYNTSGFEIRRINFVGSGRTTNRGSGVTVYADLPLGVKLPYLRIDSIDAGGFGQYGISIGTWNSSTGFSDVRVTNSSAHDNGQGGVTSYAQNAYANQNFYIGHVTAYNNTGVAGQSTNSGSGIALGGVTGGVIERCIARDNGALNTASEGPVGIWAYDSDGITIQYNESYRNRTSGTADGGGFDLDQNTRNSLVQYNYSHDNDGPGYLIAHAPNNSNHSGNTIRYNVSENDGRRNATGAVVIFGRTIGAEIYNNSVYLKSSLSGASRAVNVFNATIPAQDVQRVHFRNNAFFADSGSIVLSVSADQLNGAVDLRFEGNGWFSRTMAPRFLWGNTTFWGIGAWRTKTTQETLGGVPVGYQGDPQFTAAGAGGTIGNADLLTSLGAYKLKSTSPLINRGLNLLARFGVNPGSIDFYAASTPFGAGYDVGAHEWR